MTFAGRRETVAPCAVFGPDIEWDEFLLTRFNARMTKLFTALLCLYVVLLIVYAVWTDLVFTVIHVAMFLITIGLFAVIKDRLLFFFASNAAWFWSFSTYLYSAAHLQPVDEGLNDPIKSSMLGLLLLVASGAGVGFMQLFKIGSRRAFLRSASAMAALSGFRGLMVGVGLTALLISAIFPNATASSVAGTFSFMTWLGLALELIAKRGRFAACVLLWMTIGLAAVVALALNARTVLFAFGLFLIFAHVLFSPRIWNAKVLIAAYLSFSAASIFSDAVLSVRLERGLSGASNPVEATLEKLLSIDSMETLIFPFRESEIRRDVTNFSESYMTDASFMSRFLGTDSGFTARLVNLPFADMVCGRTPRIDRIRWDQLGALFINAMPNVGFEKSQNYADLVTWELQLRDYGSIGYPMITSVCELYTMGGWTFAFVMSFIFMAIISFWYRVLSNAIGNHIAHILIFGQMAAIGLTFTTGIATIVVPVTRSFPTMFIMLFLLKGFASAIKSRPTSRLLASPQIPARRP